PPTSARQHSQGGTAKTVGILQQEEAENGHQHQPGNEDNPASNCRQHHRGLADDDWDCIVNSLDDRLRHVSLREVLIDLLALTANGLTVVLCLLQKLRELTDQLRN